MNKLLTVNGSSKRQHNTLQSVLTLTRYFTVCLMFFLLGVLLSRAHLTSPDALSAHFMTEGTTAVGFALSAFLARIIPVLVLLLSALTYFSGAVSCLTLAFCSAVGGVGVYAVLYFKMHMTAYVLWTALTLASLLACAFLARKFFLSLFVYKEGYQNKKSLWLYIGFCALFLLLQLIISILYACLAFAGK